MGPAPLYDRKEGHARSDALSPCLPPWVATRLSARQRRTQPTRSCCHWVSWTSIGLFTRKSIGPFVFFLWHLRAFYTCKMSYVTNINQSLCVWQNFTISTLCLLTISMLYFIIEIFRNLMYWNRSLFSFQTAALLALDVLVTAVTSHWEFLCLWRPVTS